jgi:hypothetical protein
VGFSIHDPAIQTALERGLISREQLGLPPLSPPAPPPSRPSTAVATAEPGRWSITLEVGCQVRSEPNERCHWAVRRRRFQEQAGALRTAWEASPFAVVESWEHLLPLRVTFTRVGKRKLDTDNLSGGFKGLRDALAELLGIDDGDELLTWEYQQERGQPGVRLHIEGRT